MVILHDQYIIGTGTENLSFIHLDISIKSGKPHDTLKLSSEAILEHLKIYISQYNIESKPKISVSISEISSFFAS